MKNIICTIVLYLSFSLLHAQDTAHHTIAILNIDRVHEYAIVDYNNGEQTDLWKLLHLKNENVAARDHLPLPGVSDQEWL